MGRFSVSWVNWAFNKEHLNVSSLRRCFFSSSHFHRPVTFSHKVGAASHPDKTQMKCDKSLNRHQFVHFYPVRTVVLVLLLSLRVLCKRFYYSTAVSICRERLGFSFFPSRRNNKTAAEACKTNFLWIIQTFCLFTKEDVIYSWQPS